MSLLDSYSESNQDQYESIRVVHPATGSNGYNSARYQSFKPSNTVPLTSCKFYLKKVGSPVGNLAAILYAQTGTYGSSDLPTGNVLATSVSVAMAGLSASSFALFEFTFDGTYTLTSGTAYVLVVYAADATTLDTTTNYILVGADESSPSHAGLGGGYDHGIPGWWYSGTVVYTPFYDLCFYVYGSSLQVACRRSMVGVGL
jgi:hypothetical protein